MRKLALPILILGLAAVSAAWAADGTGDSAPPTATNKAATAPATALPDAPAAAKTAATAPANTAAPTAATPAIESELAELRSLLHAQAAEIEAQRRELAEMKAKLGSVKDEAVTAAVSAAVPAATSAATEAATAAVPAATPAAVLPSNVVTAGPDGSGDGQGESPLALHFKGITLTPGGFTAAETAYRNRALSADVNTPFNNLSNVFSGSDQSKISEFNFSGRQSRISMLMSGKLANATIGGYYEGDFLGAGSSSNNNESNSYVFRQRQFWGQVRLDSGWIFTGGQMWSLVTENRKLLDNRTEATPMTIDAQYSVGFSWARQYGFRIVKDLDDNKLALGFSVEGAQTRFTASNANANFFIQAPGNPGGLYNVVNQSGQAGATQAQDYTLNATPDFIFKAAWEPGWGHYEIFGAIRTFRARDYPCGGAMSLATAALLAPAACGAPLVAADETLLANNDTRAGGFGGLNLRVPIFNKKVDIGWHMLYGDGVGRYGSGSLADATIRPDGTLVPLHGGQGLATIEWHVTPMLDVYMNGGGEYIGRAVYAEPAGITGTNEVGYGLPLINDSGCNSPVESAPTGNLPSGAANCSGQARTLFEGTLGFWHRIWKGDKGTVQWGLQYSYVQWNAWSGSTGAATAAAQYHPSANDNMLFTSFRYYLP